jgi:hypothetical protein
MITQNVLDAAIYLSYACGCWNMFFVGDCFVPPGTIIEFSIGKSEPLFMRYIGVSDE